MRHKALAILALVLSVLRPPLSASAGDFGGVAIQATAPGVTKVAFWYDRTSAELFDLGRGIPAQVDQLNRALANSTLTSYRVEFAGPPAEFLPDPEVGCDLEAIGGHFALDYWKDIQVLPLVLIRRNLDVLVGLEAEIGQVA